MAWRAVGSAARSGPSLHSRRYRAAVDSVSACSRGRHVASCIFRGVHAPGGTAATHLCADVASHDRSCGAVPWRRASRQHSAQGWIHVAECLRPRIQIRLWFNAKSAYSIVIGGSLQNQNPRGKLPLCKGSLNAPNVRDRSSPHCESRPIPSHASRVQLTEARPQGAASEANPRALDHSRRPIRHPSDPRPPERSSGHCASDPPSVRTEPRNPTMG